jgi:3-hydroxybutyryl-CoA dehydrogenase
MKNVVVIVGCGIMGVDIVALFAQQRWKAIVVEPKADKWKVVARRIDASLAQMGAYAEIGAVSFVESIDRVDFTGVRLVIETVTEQLEVKRRVFAQLDVHVPAHIPIGSNSSSLRITDIASGCSTPDRMANTHFFLPANIVPLVEIARGKRTSAQTCANLRSIFSEVGRVPVVIEKDIPGFLANRIQHALMREAFSLIDRKLATVDDVNAAVQYGFGFRYVAAGPILQKEFAGLETQCAAASAIYPSLCNDDHPAQVLQDLVDNGKFGMKTGEGFQVWTPESAKAARARYSDVLLQAAKLLDSPRTRP